MLHMLACIYTEITFFWRFHSLLYSQVSLSSVTSIIDGLKKLYIKKLKPLEVTYRFHDFVSPALVSEQVALLVILWFKVNPYYIV